MRTNHLAHMQVVDGYIVLTWGQGLLHTRNNYQQYNTHQEDYGDSQVDLDGPWHVWSGMSEVELAGNTRADGQPQCLAEVVDESKHITDGRHDQGHNTLETQRVICFRTVYLYQTKRSICFALNLYGSFWRFVLISYWNFKKYSWIKRENEIFFA